MKTKNMTSQHFGKSIDQSPLRLVFFLIALVLTCFALSPVARAQDGAVGPFPNGNTAEGFMALHSLTTGVNNTAIGVNALFSDTDAHRACVDAKIAAHTAASSEFLVTAGHYPSGFTGKCLFLRRSGTRLVCSISIFSVAAFSAS